MVGCAINSANDVVAVFDGRIVSDMVMSGMKDDEGMMSLL